MNLHYETLFKRWMILKGLSYKVEQIQTVGCRDELVLHVYAPCVDTEQLDFPEVNDKRDSHSWEKTDVDRRFEDLERFEVFSTRDMFDSAWDWPRSRYELFKYVVQSWVKNGVNLYCWDMKTDTLIYEDEIEPTSLDALRFRLAVLST